MPHKPRPPGWVPPDATAYCILHRMYMNDWYVHRRRCVLKGNKTICKHLIWLKGDRSHDPQ